MKDKILYQAIDVAGRIPPSDERAEKTILSTLLNNPTEDVLDELMSILSEEVFYNHAHRVVFQAIKKVYQQKNPVDLQYVCSTLQDMDKLYSIGNVTFLAEITDQTPSVLNPAKTAQRLIDKHKQRNLLQVFQTLVAEGFAAHDDVSAWIEQAQAKVYQAATENAEQRKWGSNLNELNYEMMEYLAGTKTKPPPIRMGVKALDHATNGGLRRGELVIVAGRPGMGKTALMLTFANSILQEGLGCFFFSLEMPKISLSIRLIAIKTRIPGTVIKTSMEGVESEQQLTPEHANILLETLQSSQQIPMRIDDKPSITLSYARNEMRKFSTKFFPGKKLGVVFFDYLQLMKSEGKTESREQEIAEIARSLKELAKEFDCVVVAGAQLNRKVEERATKRPQISDLRESGAVEQDADMIFFPFRPKYAERKPGEDQRTTSMEEAEIIIGKQREGACGSVPVLYAPRFTLFQDMIEERNHE